MEIVVIYLLFFYNGLKAIPIDGMEMEE